MHSRLSEFRSGRKLGSIAHFETCVLVRHPLKVVESFYRYGVWQIRSAARTGMRNFPAKGWSFDEWITFLREELTGGGASAPAFVDGINAGAVREAMLSTSFDDFLERVADSRWERYLRNYTSRNDVDVAVNTVLKLEEPIAIRKYFKSRYFVAFRLVHANSSGQSEPLVWSKPMRQRFNGITEAEHQTFGYDIIE